jgi:hypothetical protein
MSFTSQAVLGRPLKLPWLVAYGPEHIYPHFDGLLVSLFVLFMLLCLYASNTQHSVLLRA